MTVIPFPAQDPQHSASDPAASVFVTANAGSGKTTTLVNRVARLLLGRAEPGAILCVTYTKAAASEMQRRLFQQLGEWSTMEDEALRRDLARVEGKSEGDYVEHDLREARKLFARALETPGGLKIQTIHAFCEKLLRRFPLEADVSPGFTVMDDASAAEIVGEARAAVAEMALKGEGLVAEAYARLSVALAFDDFQKMFAAFETERAAIADYVERVGGPDGVVADVWARCGFDEGPADAETLEREAAARTDRLLWKACAEALTATGGVADGKCADVLRRVADNPGARFDDLLAALFTGGGADAPAAWVARTKAFAGREDLRARLLDEQDRLSEARSQVRSARVAQDTVNALTLAQAYIAFYQAGKAARGALDFADLILRTCELLTRRADAAWVLFKLDGGIDHVLVDEAQDTAPEQWRILRALTSEFFAGFGLPADRALERTLFVVGDQKQSIYSFQGAAPHLLIEERTYYRDLIQAAARQFRLTPLVASWRSTPQVLAFVDALFADPDHWTGVRAGAEDGDLVHQAKRVGENGCVELWPLVREEKGEEREAWEDPLDLKAPDNANRRVAEHMAAEIKALVERGDAVSEKRTWRPAGYGDVLILVRRRGALFEEVLRALKRSGVPVAGADRLALSEHIAFDDLMALGRFVQFPEDDLTLAALLRSPFCDLGETSLFDLAYDRRGTPLWEILRDRAEERHEWATALAVLDEAIKEGRSRRPFDFYARFLAMTDGAGRSIRACVTTRLGAEAADVLDEFLAQALAAERAGVHDLERLLAAFASLDITVKRELEGPRGEVRVMTVHGAKGLEAPIVFMPETTLTRTARGSPLMKTDDGGFLWCSSSKNDCPSSLRAREWRARREEEETQRLLYVGLTRARDRLILTGRIPANAKRDAPKDWYAAAERALDDAGVSAAVRSVELNGLEVRRYGPDPQRLAPAGAARTEGSSLPEWARVRARAEGPAARYAAPSTLAETERGPAPSPLLRIGGLGRFRRGDLIHKLLQLLPDIAPAERADAAARLLARERDLEKAQRTEMAAAALAVLEDARFADVFGPASRAEVAIAGAAAELPDGMAISGRVDRLLVQPDRVLVADFKTNRPSPDRVEDADRAYLAQMAVYVAVLRAVFPGRRIEAALVWTDGPKLMPIPENIVARELARLGAGG